MIAGSYMCEETEELICRYAQYMKNSITAVQSTNDLNFS